MTEAEKKEALHTLVTEAATQCRNMKCLAEATETAEADLETSRTATDKAEGKLKDILGPILDDTCHLVRLAETLAVEIEYCRELDRLIVRHIQVVPFGTDPAILSEDTIRSAVYDFLNAVKVSNDAAFLVDTQKKAQGEALKTMNQSILTLPLGVYDLGRGQYLKVYKPSILHLKTCAIESFWKASA